MSGLIILSRKLRQIQIQYNIFLPFAAKLMASSNVSQPVNRQHKPRNVPPPKLKTLNTGYNIYLIQSTFCVFSYNS
jgi:hypothetical protein